MNNNGKVRIYELSKELDLENKDILAVCEDLAIAVKSHSSTISDEDAVRIRAAVQNQSSGAVAKPPSRSSSKPAAVSKPAVKNQQKQQILEIRRSSPSDPPSPIEPVRPEASQPSGIPPRPSETSEVIAPSSPRSGGSPNVPSSPGSGFQASGLEPNAPLRGSEPPLAPAASAQPPRFPDSSSVESSSIHSERSSTIESSTPPPVASPSRPVSTAQAVDASSASAQPPSASTPTAPASSSSSANSPRADLAGPPKRADLAPSGGIPSATPPAGIVPPATPAKPQVLSTPSVGQSSNARPAAKANPKPQLSGPPERPAKPTSSAPSTGSSGAGSSGAGSSAVTSGSAPSSSGATPRPSTPRPTIGQGTDGRRPSAGGSPSGSTGASSGTANKRTQPGARKGDSPKEAPKKELPQIVGPPRRPVAKTEGPPSPRPGGDRPVRPERPERKPVGPDLQRPRTGRSSSADGTPVAGALDDSISVVTPPRRPDVVPELRRPAELPKSNVRKGKAWEEEEEEERNKAAAKLGNRNKKRVHIIGEDEDELNPNLDDLDETDGEDDAAFNISMSLARPPKPKSMQTVAKPPTPTASKVRRSDSRDRNQRRERNSQQENKRERPEILSLTGGLTVQELADAIVAPETDIIRSLFFKGIAATVTQTLDIPTIQLVCEEFSILVEQVQEESAARKVTEVLDAADLDNLHRRPPVVTVMGHVDHGKTSLLDSIRKTKVAAGEAGGITQHIGAYHVDVEHNGAQHQIVFLDTPGHEAFTAMRARGARVTDIAILVVAADDGVRPQTIEAISHAKAAKVPIIVAINKVDKEQANVDRVKQELMEHGLVPEEWGGDTIMVPVSALKGDNLDTLLDMILLVSEVEELSANPDRAARGSVIEANLDKARGPVATFLIQNGTLRVGDVLVVGSVLGKVRAMIDDRGARVESAGPSLAVEVLGLSDVPAAGDEFEVYRDEKQARALASERSSQQRASRLQQAMASRRVTLNSLSARAQEGELKELNLILKADVQGSVEAILASLEQLPQDEVQLRVLLAAPGEVTETDVDLAAASGAVVIGFSTTLASGSKRAADEAGVDIREYDIIYKLLEDIEGAMEGLLEPEMVEEPLGQVEVRAVYPVGRGSVAGCYVLSGKAVRNCHIRVHRGKEVVYTGVLDSLRRMRDDVKEVNAGYECGIGIDRFNTWQENDIIETYRMVTKRRILAGKSGG